MDPTYCACGLPLDLRTSGGPIHKDARLRRATAHYRGCRRWLTEYGYPLPADWQNEIRDRYGNAVLVETQMELGVIQLDRIADRATLLQHDPITRGLGLEIAAEVAREMEEEKGIMSP